MLKYSAQEVHEFAENGKRHAVSLLSELFKRYDNYAIREIVDSIVNAAVLEVAAQNMDAMDKIASTDIGVFRKA